jgi:hypothetical protein
MLDEEDFLPQNPMWVNAEECLANRDEDGKMQDRVWCHLPELNAIVENKAAKELVGWDRQPMVQKSDKHKSESDRRIRTRI